MIGRLNLAEVVISVTYPTTNQTNAKTDITGRYVSLRVEDRASGQILVQVEMSAATWVQILAQQYTVIEDAAITAHPERLGKQHTRTQLDAWKVGGTRRLPDRNRDQYLEEQRLLAEQTSGYEVVTIQKHNWGVELIGHAWVEPTEVQ